MPDPLVYLQAFVIVASASALVALALGWRLRLPNPMLVDGIGVTSIAIGQAVGIYWLRLPIGWPPASALDRYLVVVLPAVMAVELIAAFPKFPTRGVLALRLMLAASIARVLLHDSVYLEEWAAWQTFVALVSCAALVVGVWLSLARLAERSPGISLPLAIALAIQGAGVSIMLAGYIRGGAAAMVTTAALLGTTLACARGAKRMPQTTLVAFGVVSLCSLLIIGVFFGRLPVASALALLMSPALCWLTEFGGCRNRSVFVVGIIRLTIVAVVVIMVVLVAQRKFEREFRPLLSTTAQSSLLVP